MSRDVFITTSWDDGHELDRRVIDLLHKHGLCGTFYVPRAFTLARPMHPSQYATLGSHIEVGAHTMSHVELTRCDDATASREIAESRDFIQDALGTACAMFCPPCGKFARRHVPMIRDAGFTGFRTVEAWSLGRPRPRRGVYELPTSVQAYHNSAVASTRNLLKRASQKKTLRNSVRFLRHGIGRDWLTALERCLDEVLKRGGVLHLWGHSWEVEQAGQWERLDEAMSLLSRACADGGAVAMTNGQLTQRFASLHHNDLKTLRPKPALRLTHSA